MYVVSVEGALTVHYNRKCQVASAVYGRLYEREAGTTLLAIIGSSRDPRVDPLTFTPLS